MDFGAKAATYVDTFMDVVQWRNVDHLFRKLADETGGDATTR
jgi:superoxide dismutase